MTVWIKRLLLVAVFSYLVLVAIVFVIQRSFIYFPDTDPSSPLEAGLAKFEVAEISLNDIQLNSWWHAPEQGEPVVLLFHGNAGALRNRAFIFKDIEQMGFGLLAVGYPGYGGNAGAPSQFAMTDTARANYDWLLNRGVMPDQIVIFGASLGGGVAMTLAPEVEAAGLVLEATFTGADDLGAQALPWLPVKLLIKDKYRNLDRATNLKMPLSWYHGTKDEVIPFEMGQKLFDAFPSEKCATIISDGRHNDLWGRGADQVLKNSVEAFAANELPC